jgi:raffinose/stachyose/melibiose transport system permease protein
LEDVWVGRLLDTRLRVAAVLVLPALSVYTLVVIYPLIASLWGSLFEWNGLTSGRFVGLDNFFKLFQDPIYSTRLFGAFTHNVLWFLGIMVIQNVAGMLIAYLLYTRRGRISFFQSAYFLPAILSPILVGALWRIILSPAGPLNSILGSVGLASGPIPWLGDGNLALSALVMVDAWNWLGLPLLVFLAGFNDIPAELMQAAKLEGAGSTRILFSIALPLVMPSVVIVSILTFINAFNQFDIVYIMEGPEGNPGHATDVLGTFFYQLAFGTQGASGLTQIGLALAVATVLMLFLAAGTIFGLRALGSRVVEF